MSSVPRIKSFAVLYTCSGLVTGYFENGGDMELALFKLKVLFPNRGRYHPERTIHRAEPFTCSPGSLQYICFNGKGIGAAGVLKSLPVF